MNSESNLHDFQINAIDFVLDKKKCALFLDMGLGKTVIALTVASNFLSNKYVDRILVIAPFRVAQTVWKQEVSKWEHLKHLTIDLCCGGTSKSRMEILENSKADIVVINKENVYWLVQQIRSWDFDMIIIDESSSFKSSRTKRFRAMRSVISSVRSIILLTGTPSPNGLMDLWAQLFLIDRGRRLGKSLIEYQERFFTSSGYMGYQWKMRYGSENEIKDLIKDVCIRMDSKDYIDLPKLINIYEYAEFSKKVYREYRELEKEFILMLDSGISVEAVSGGALVSKLLQMCNGAIYDSEHKTHEIHDSKIKVMKEIIEDNPNENFLVAYNFKSDLSRIQKAFPHAVVLSRYGEELEDWNKGKIKILLAHPMSAAHGLNAQFGGSAIIWFGLNWSLELYLQFNARIYRQGQLKPVRIIHIVTKDGIDEKVLGALKNKARTQKELLDHLKKTLK